MSSSRPALEVAEVVRRFNASFHRSHATSHRQRLVLDRLAACRTARMGGHRRRCAGCGHVEQAYNSCGDRHCNKCQAGRRAEWLTAREQDLLPVEYFHVVFTLPAELSPLALVNPAEIYDLLFQASAETLREVAARRLGARIGFLSVLHTWGQNLMHHPHVHVVVPGGGLSLDGDRWVACPAGFFLPVKVLSRVFRAKFAAGLRRLHRGEQLRFAGRTGPLADRSTFERFVEGLFEKPWVVYAKPPFGGPRQVLKYLARYTHRVAISNRRLRAIDDRTVTFAWKDYRRGSRQRQMTLTGEEFLRRLAMHVLPRGFVRLRQFGLLANGVRGQRLALCRRLLVEGGQAVPEPESGAPHDDADAAPGFATATVHDEAGKTAVPGCPKCGRRVWLVEVLPRPSPDELGRSAA